MNLPELTSITPAELAAIIGADLLNTGPEEGLKGISLDTRSLCEGDLFFAIPGENFDGHAFLNDAVERKAWGTVISKDITFQTDISTTTVLKTDDTVKALGNLAAYVRNSRKEMTVIGITGSNGKTTTKELLKKALSEKGITAASPKNYNNFIGVPLSILGTPADARFSIIEMGTESPGEIEYLASFVRPDIAVVTNVGDTHLKYLHSREGVAREKAEIYTHLADNGIGVVNADDEFADFFTSRVKGPSVSFGMECKADIWGTVTESDEKSFTVEVNSTWSIRCGLPGIHNSMNLLAALGVCKALGFEPGEFEHSFDADINIPGMRMERTVIREISCYNDAYNANPQSVRAGIAFFSGLAVYNGNKKIMVLGDMRDLGPSSDSLHSKIGALITGNVANVLITVGEHARHAGISAGSNDNPPNEIIHCTGIQEAGEALFSAAQPGDILYMKASRSVELERILEKR